MDRLIHSAQRLAGLLLVCAVVLGAARASVFGDHAVVPIVIAFGLVVYLGFRALRAVRRLIPKRNARAVRPPVLPTRAHWMSPRNLQRRGRP